MLVDVSSRFVNTSKISLSFVEATRLGAGETDHAMSRRRERVSEHGYVESTR